jgi:hypothetical protein
VLLLVVRRSRGRVGSDRRECCSADAWWPEPSLGEHERCDLLGNFARFRSTVVSTTTTRRARLPSTTTEFNPQSFSRRSRPRTLLSCRAVPFVEKSGRGAHGVGPDEGPLADQPDLPAAILLVGNGGEEQVAAPPEAERAREAITTAQIAGSFFCRRRAPRSSPSRRAAVPTAGGATARVDGDHIGCARQDQRGPSAAAGNAPDQVREPRPAPDQLALDPPFSRRAPAGSVVGVSRPGGFDVSIRIRSGGVVSLRHVTHARPSLAHSPTDAGARRPGAPARC